MRHAMSQLRLWWVMLWVANQRGALGFHYDRSQIETRIYCQNIRETLNKPRPLKIEKLFQNTFFSRFLMIKNIKNLKIYLRKKFLVKRFQGSNETIYLITSYIYKLINGLRNTVKKFYMLKNNHGLQPAVKYKRLFTYHNDLEKQGDLIDCFVLQAVTQWWYVAQCATTPHFSCFSIS